MRVSPTPARISLGLLALLLLAPLFALNYQAQHRLNDLKTSGAISIAKISSLDCGNHGHVYYSFSLKNRTFGGDGNLLSCNQTNIGATLPVVYSVHDPTNSELNLDDRQQDLSDRYLMLLVLAGMISVGIYIATRVDGTVSRGGR